MDDKKKIVSLALRLPCNCNLNCRYCYGKVKEKGEKLRFSEIKDILFQAYDLGLSIIYIVGDGEPLLYSNLRNLIKMISNMNMNPVLYSNLTLMTGNFANFLYKKNVIIVGKQNTLCPTKQDDICRVRDSYIMIMRGIKYLKESGFTKTIPSRLKLHTVILKENFMEIKQMWQKWRKDNIRPEVQVLVYPSNNQDKQYYKYYNKNMPQPNEIRKLFEELSKMDKEEFGIEWNPIHAYPIAPIGCNIHYNGIGVSQDGEVQICSYTEDSLGNIRYKTLKEILQSNKAKKIRNVDRILDYPHSRYGCRANAYNLTGDRFGLDPIYDKFLGR